VRSFGLLGAGQTPCGQPLGLSHAHALMVLLEQARAELETRQQDLGRALGIDKSNVTRLCRRMEAAGHLLQTPHPGDGRARSLRLTPRGLRLAGEVEHASAGRFARLAALLPRGRCHSVLASLQLLNQAITRLTEPPAKEPPP
jgi:DNA-binding MarR family transcriptional regulator